ncbi:MAG: hypothetical protein CM15mP93_11450 [Thiotrichaceae bacterium]|nr:MAG: hypothetical protein CM15mP93_11450 [Thiotrichaceae bacterium]
MQLLEFLEIIRIILIIIRKRKPVEDKLVMKKSSYQKKGYSLKSTKEKSS